MKIQENGLSSTYGRRYVRAFPGMLMGMYNAASTTLGLTAVGYKINKMSIDLITLMIRQRFIV